jgi:hypothetical protein
VVRSEAAVPSSLGGWMLVLVNVCLVFGAHGFTTLACLAGLYTFVPTAIGSTITYPLA